VRRLFTPMWLARHALALALIAACLLLGAWQLGRAAAGNMLSWAYTLEWPLFAVFVGWIWVRAVRDDRSLARGEDPYADVRPPPLRRRPGSGWPPASAATRGDEADDPQLAAYNRYLAWLAANPDRKPSEYTSESTG
jgi:hypothetical protein